MKEILTIVLEYIENNNLWNRIWLKINTLKIILILTNNCEIEIREEYLGNITINKKEYSKKILNKELEKLLKE